jgi:hypothetical protein
MKIYKNFKNLLNRLLSLTLKRNSVYYKEYFYSSIKELPIFNWWEISDGNYNFIMLNRTSKVPEKYIVGQVELLQQEFFNNYGVSDEFEVYFQNQKDLLELEVDLAITGDRFLKTKITLLKKRIEQEIKYKRKGEEYEVKAYVDKFLGFRLDAKNTTVTEYYSYIDLMKKDNGKN